MRAADALHRSAADHRRPRARAAGAEPPATPTRSARASSSFTARCSICCASAASRRSRRSAPTSIRLPPGGDVRSQQRRIATAKSCRSCGAATCSAIACCGRRWSRWRRRREQARLLRDPRRHAHRHRGGDQERVPQDGAPVPSRSQPRRQGGRGQLQGGAEAYAILADTDKRAHVRPLRPRRARRRGDRRLRSDGLHRLRGHPRRPRRHLRHRRDVRRPAAARRTAARRRPALRPRDLVRRIGQGRRDDDPDSAARNLRDVQGLRRGGRIEADRPARSATDAASFATSRASSPSRARAASAAAPARSSARRARPATAPGACSSSASSP